ncbi:unnamed protein product [Linum tenue]|uniref:High mobility group B protein 9 n=1 Tax=Linum tenue TaxID=586396 RepID=A0AAV0HAR2_9ROSI|nr:unnamed protein product [Linum tenue]
MSPAGRKRRVRSGEEGGRGGEVIRKFYPAPLAAHEVVVEDGVAFWSTLRRFHFLMGTTFSIPVIGGKYLDLHVLYIEATKRGGFEKVVAEKKWKEVGSVFRFSRTTTSASFVLRKHYLEILYHYEQVHLFRVQGPIFAEIGKQKASRRRTGGRRSFRKPTVAVLLGSSSAPHSNSVRNSSNPVPAKEPSTFTATGTIETKFESGYIVSMKIGTEILTGVLYHSVVAPSSIVTAQVAPPRGVTTAAALVSFAPRRSRHYGGGGDGGRRRRDSRRRMEDPDYPKSNRSGYNFFFAERHYQLKKTHPKQKRDFTKMIGQAWTNLSAEEKSVYQTIGTKDKERYKRQLKEYHERKKLKLAAEGSSS